MCITKPLLMHTAKLLLNKFLLKLKNKKIILLSLLVVGPMLVSIGLFLLFYERTILSFKRTPEKAVLTVGRKPAPARIIIDDLGINLPVAESQIVSGIWEISSKGASHLDISARPGENGNIVIYGHNRKVIFGSLPYIWVGDTIKIVNAEGQTFKYKVVNKATVKPDNLEFVLPKSEEVLTVYTCNGFLDTTRFVAIAKPI